MPTRIPEPPRRERAAPDWPECCAALPPEADLWRREIGATVTNHRTSWVRQLPCGTMRIYAKTYDYPSWASRLRAFGRRTAPWGTPRPVREFDALQWLAANGLPTARPLAALVWRHCGFVVRATLLTAEFAGEAATTLLPRLPPDAQRAAARAIGNFVRRLHGLGFRDRNLDLRNLLLAPAATGWTVAKIDSPRFVLRPAGPGTDALTRADWARLLPQLAALGLADAAAEAPADGAA